MFATMKRARVLVCLLLVGALSEVRAQVTSTPFESDRNSEGRSSWSSSLFVLSAVERQALNQGDASIFNYSYVSINYSLDRNSKLSFRPTYLLSSSGLSGRGDEVAPSIKTGDFHFAYSNYELAKWDQTGKMAGTVYWDFPTSDSAKAKTLQTQLRSWLTFAQDIAPKWTLVYNFKPKLSFFRDKILVSQRSTPNGKVSAKSLSSVSYNQWAQLDHTLELGYRLNRSFNPFLEAGFVHDVSYTEDPNSSFIQDSVKFSAGSWIGVMRGLSFRAFIQNVVPQKARKDSVGYFRDNGETQFILMSIITLL